MAIFPPLLMFLLRSCNDIEDRRNYVWTFEFDDVMLRAVVFFLRALHHIVKDSI